MDVFQKYLEQFGEVGYVQELFSQIVSVKGLPGVRIGERVVFEDGAWGQVFGLQDDMVEVLLLSSQWIAAGSRVARSGTFATIPVGQELLGTIIDPLASQFLSATAMERRPVDQVPTGLPGRTPVSQPFPTGSTIVDMVVPLGKGQRELVIGDRKTGKSTFLLHAATTAARQGIVCIYAVIGKKAVQASRIARTLSDAGVFGSSVIVATSSADPAGLIFLTPYTAMTIAEYFRDQGKDIMVILDDLTTHAKFYREIALLARRFPGRSSYPGDIFYIHSRLLERAGSFAKGTISCFPVAETIAGELSGFIQTNIMSITDGHLFFDKAVFNEGRRPAINSYLSVTRVGYQAQTPLVRSVAREVSRFLSHYKRLRDFLHFGAEVGYSVQSALKQGEMLMALLHQRIVSIPMAASLLLIGGIWSQAWSTLETDAVVAKYTAVIERYAKDEAFRSRVDALIVKANSLQQLVAGIKQEGVLNF